jgi:hypothetical protein
MGLPVTPAGLAALAEDHLYTAGGHLTNHARTLLQNATNFFVGHTGAVGVLILEGDLHNPMFLRSGHEGGPWGGTQRGGIPRMPGWGCTMRAPHEGNIATHVEARWCMDRAS